ncbi:MAG: helix-turn-helix transcriptional regulator [Phycisphaerales bacterium]
MVELNPAQVAAWLRSQAAKYTAMAEQLERDFGGLGNMPPNAPLSPVALLSPAPSVDRVKRMMGSRKMRQADIAADLGLPPSVLSDVLTEENGFVRGDRGWIWVQQEDGGEATD